MQLAPAETNTVGRVPVRSSLAVRVLRMPGERHRGMVRGTNLARDCLVRLTGSFKLALWRVQRTKQAKGLVSLFVPV
jgi:hypothetical protein